MASDGSNPDADAMAKAINDMVASGQEIDANFTRQFTENQKQVADAQSALFSSLTGGGGFGRSEPKDPPKLEEIIATLRGQPVMIDPVHRFLGSLADKLRAAIDNAINSDIEKDPPPS